MNRHIATRLACSLLLGLPLAAQESILPYLPKDTLAVMSAPNLNGSIERFAQMPLAKMWAEDEVQKFVADLREMAASMIAMQMDQAKEMHAQGEFPVDPADLMALRVHGFTVALTSIRMVEGDFGSQPDIGIVAHLDFGASAPTWNKLLDVGLGMLEEELGGMLEKTEGKIGEVRTVTFRPSSEEGTTMGLNLAMVPNGLLITTLTPDLQIIVDGMQKKVPAMGAATDYEAMVKRMASANENPECEMFVRWGSMMKSGFEAFRAAAGDEEIDSKIVERAMNAMGAFQAAPKRSISSYVDGKDITRTLENLPAGTKAQVGPIDMKFLKWIPKDTVSFMSGSFEDTIFYPMLKALEVYDAEATKQLLGAMGGHYVYWQMPVSTFSAAPELAFVMKADEAKLIPTLRGLIKRWKGVSIEENEKRGIKFYELRVDSNQLERMQGLSTVLNTIQPTLAFKDGYMVASLSPNDIKRTFQRMDREDDPKGDIRSNKEFAGIKAQLPTSLEFVSFTDSKSQFESLYQILAGALPLVRLGDDVPIDLQLLPESATLTKHLFPITSYATSNADGRTTVTTSPFGAEIYAMSGMLAVIGFTLGMSQGMRR